MTTQRDAGLTRSNAETLLELTTQLVDQQIAVSESQAVLTCLEEAITVADWLRDYISFDSMREEIAQLIDTLEALCDDESAGQFLTAFRVIVPQPLKSSLN